MFNKNFKMVSREKMAQRTNSLQWRVTPPSAKSNYMLTRMDVFDQYESNRQIKW